MEPSSATSGGVDPRAFRNAMGRFTTGVTVITAMLQGRIHGMTANGFMSVSLEPPLVLVSIASTAKMHGVLSAAGAYGVSVLCDEQEDLSWHFAGRSRGDLAIDFRFEQGVPLIAGALAQIACKLSDAHRAGDHTLFIGLVRHFAVRENARPLVFHAGRYHDLHEPAPQFAHSWSGFALDPHGP